jgi:hypothetical protein
MTEQTEQTVIPVLATRGERGRFALGNPGGPGNPAPKRMAEIRRAIAEAVDAQKVGELFNALIARAVDGDNAAAAIALPYVLGKPQELPVTESGGVAADARRMMVGIAIMRAAIRGDRVAVAALVEQVEQERNA